MNQHSYQRRLGSPDTIPTVIFFLLIANGLVFAAQQFPSMAEPLSRFFALWPWRSVFAEFYPWQLVSYGFLHGSAVHLLFNMFMLWMFGRELEVLMGTRRFFLYYMTCVVGAGVIQLVVSALEGSPYPVVGASGGVFGLLLAFGMTFPNRVVMLLFPPIPMKAKYMVVLFGLLELYLGFSGRAPGIANFAHLGGMLFGFLLLQRWKRPQRRF
ncbi:MAG: rhomboid family intramembrane serine protease [Woeseiaceae bacterium]|nr:rhomboid family intramembrane serine protease [Woeseiaceae bacterium]